MGGANGCTTSGLPDAQDVGITTDGGATYTILNDCFPLTDGSGTLTHQSFDLSSFLGQEVQVSFVYDGTDPASVGIFFAVDNVRIHAGDECLHPAVPDGSPCSDGQFCNGEETCAAGFCAEGASPICDDGDPCTADACNAGPGSCAFTGPFDSEIAAGGDAVCGTADDNAALFGPDGLCGTGDDTTGDGSCDELDNCLAEHNPGQENADGDPRGDLCDCLPANAQAWSLPGGAADVMFADDQTLVWSSPAETGAVSVAYDTIRSSSPLDFDTGAVCVESQDASDTTSLDPTLPAPGQVLNYLVRSLTTCGAGPIGVQSNGTPRSARFCP